MDVMRLLRSQEAVDLGVSQMTESQRKALSMWGLRMFALGQHHLASIDAIKFEGRLIILDDGSRWEVGAGDARTADLWSMGDSVIVADDVMYLVEGAEQVAVEEEIG